MPVTINGSAGVTTNSGAVYNGIQSGTAVSASGTSVDFTSIPSWVKRITVMFSGVSTNGTSSYLVQLGSGSITSSGYNGSGSRTGTAAVGASSSSAGMLIATYQATNNVNGYCTITNLTGNVWSMQLTAAESATTLTYSSASAVTLSGTLDRVRITTVNGTDTFDAGSINILYE